MAEPEPIPGRKARRQLAGVAILVVGFLGCVGLAQKPYHMHGYEAGAIGQLKTLTNSQAIYREGDKDGNDEEDYAGNLGDLADQDLIDEQLASGTKQGYYFNLVRSPETPEYLWAATANPMKPQEYSRYFFTNYEGVTYYSTEGPIAFDPTTCAPIDTHEAVGK